MTRLERKLIQSKPGRVFRPFVRVLRPPGFQGLSLFEVGKVFFREVKHNRLNERSAAVTYNFVMAIPPTLLFLFSLVPYLPLENVQDTILDTLALITPNERIYSNVTGVVMDFMTNERTDLLSFGILLTLFFSSNGMMGLMRAFDRSLPL